MVPATKTVHNERVKLTASLVNGTAIGFGLAGGITVPFAQLTNAFPLSSQEGWAVTAFCVAMAVCLHAVGRWVLGALRD